MLPRKTLPVQRRPASPPSRPSADLSARVVDHDDPAFQRRFAAGGAPQLPLQANVVTVRTGAHQRDQLVATEGPHPAGNSGTIQPTPRCRGASDPQWEVAMSSSRTEQREASRAQRAEEREITRAQRAAHVSGRIEWYLLLAAVGFALFLALHLQLVPIVAWTGWSAAAVICALLFGILLIWVSEHRRTP
jgi:hypothetical protein